MKFIRYYMILVLAFSIVPGCAVYKAAENKGVRAGDIRNCKHKSCLLAKGMKPLQTTTLDNGEVVETYSAVLRKSGANYLRAAGHGALDVMTLGLWEVAGTPIEGVISNNRKHLVVKASYENQTSEKIQRLEVTKPNGESIVYYS